MLSVDIEHHFPGLTLRARFDAPLGVTALFGRSGTGKTTLVNAVAGLLRPDRGRITVGGQVMMDSDAKLFLPPNRRRMGYVFQEGRLFPHLTVSQNLRYGGWFAPQPPPPSEIYRIIDLLGIGALLDRRPAALSGGEKQRVALGRAILSQPRLLLMDEPLAALDDARKAEILPYLERLRDELHLPILYVSHSMAEIARLATTVVLLEQGRVTAAGPVAEVLADPALAGGFGLREAGAILTARVIGQEDDGLTRLQTAVGPVWLPRLDAPIGVEIRLRIMAQDVMLALTRPEGISALNILPVTICDLRIGDGPGAMVQLALGQDRLLARITRRSADLMGLSVGRQVFAVLKAVSVAPESIGSREA